MLNHYQGCGSTDSGPFPATSLFSMTRKQGSWDVGTDDPVRPHEEGSGKEKRTLGTQMADEVNLSGFNMIFIDQQPAARRWVRIGTTSFKYHGCMEACKEHNQ